MCWFIPLIAAAVQAISADQRRKQQEKDQTADTINAIKQRHAVAAGGDPSRGMAVDNAIRIGRADRDYQPPVNAIGAAIQAIDGGMSGDDQAPAPPKDDGLLDHSFVPRQYNDGSDLIDPWKRRY